jgi:ABC-type transport system involved in cytochrome c biogenesis permease subunit
MPAYLERVTVFCFAASYAVALAAEAARLLRPYPALRWLGLGFGSAGLLAHTIFLFAQQPPLALHFGSLLFLGWILAVFYLYGAVHHRNVAWALFVLPVVLGLTVLAALYPRADESHAAGWSWLTFAAPGERFWTGLHVLLLLLSAVGICVGFVASLMYLVQVQRLRAKALPGQGMRLLSLERLEGMNRRAVLLSFPLLTAGLLIGSALLLYNGELYDFWRSPRVLSALALWLVFAIVVYLRYAIHARGRQLAFLTILAFALMVLSLVSPVHPFIAGGGGP